MTLSKPPFRADGAEEDRTERRGTRCEAFGVPRCDAFGVEPRCDTFGVFRRSISSCSFSRRFHKACSSVVGRSKSVANNGGEFRPGGARAMYRARSSDMAWASFRSAAVALAICRASRAAAATAACDGDLR